jgi:phospholipid/cholesterol/gamma-HCH transport system substrate-binding protein
MRAGIHSTAEGWRLRLLGLAYLGVAMLLVAVSIAAYRHDFDDHVTVTVQARQAGQQLNVGSDVRMNGTIVGRVSSVSKDTTGALISLQLDRDSADRIPTDVVARILPTTLFGQKFVELHSSTSDTRDHLVDGSRIAEDRSRDAVELTTVLDDIYPLLTVVQPDQLAGTLGALAQGLDGRGAELAQTMAGAGSYLRALNRQTPLFEQDLRLFDRVARQYADQAPTLTQLLSNAATGSRFLTAQQGQWSAFLGAADAVALAGDDLLRASQANLSESARLARPTLELLARYAPELRCTIGGFLEVQRRSALQIRGNRFQGYFTIGAQADGYTARDRLRLGDVGAGPGCRGLPQASVPYPGFKLHDGVTR